VLRHFVLNGSDGGKPWPVGVMTDDERPLVLRDGRPVSGQSVTSEGAGNDERPR
jgi:manganese/iron transport system ATP-binding protein